MIDREDARVPLSLVDDGTEFRMSRMPSDGELSESIKKNGLIDKPVLLKRNEKFSIVIGHKRISACRNLGYDSIPAVIWEEFDYQQYFDEAIRKMYRRSSGAIGRIRGFLTLCSDTDFLNRIDSLRRSLLLPKDIDIEHAGKILLLPVALLLYLDEKDAPLKLIERLLSFDGEFIRLLSSWIAKPFRFSVFRAIIEIYDDIRRSPIYIENFNKCESLRDENSDEKIYGLMHKIRYPLLDKYFEETGAVILRYRAQRINLEFPQNGEGNSATVTLTLKKNDQGTSFRESLLFLEKSSIDDILKLL